MVMPYFVKQQKLICTPYTSERQSKDVHYVNGFTLNLEKEELFYPWLTHQVFFAIHSPFEPINPFLDGRAMKPGYRYIINIRLEEEHFLPYPYQTNCADYEALWEKNNKTGPRSQKMCRYMCGKNISMIAFKCEKGLTMFENIKDWCCPKKLCGHPPHLGPGLSVLLKNRKECFGSCKEECLKLKYLSTIEESVYEPSKERALEWTSGKKELTVVSIRIQDIEKTVMLHDPLYSIENLFSNIGGLMGCWLGISVWAFVNIIEKTNLILTNCMKKFKMKKQEITEEVSFYPNHLNLYHK
ncbi:uncharacterized protein TNIN_74931 [Trichonephila inaurata madagascariensis]|uniref:Uncharacterized protein n=1 Tax=Trichonephila inaurata madagascariensis TaxID=2747483 RepID=A0A8X6WTH1_9ARAC|nr:uncharacterized protein TNIN_74931 [Trichonephila inaurata madagascariensis]